ncbi:carbamoyltransferase C-terminal domain-containing protein [Rhodanobacter sp. AS-Z3]|uniref:carbamoyltransferase C-terminal domain-containing protein n=1 Tax=Rhodanobacter sp. AS-Z3 TaxID=3031330 RepID=UPI00247B0202|nr:carbamoyltransferase C-terminal domain-containing protein [Rhodanobacter sp. AS-Z3]WEN15099.1 carbamoyltransferase C-terminal domain-containing protein [Rhodanobacter sp. AS-Z3]
MRVLWFEQFALARTRGFYLLPRDDGSVVGAALLARADDHPDERPTKMDVMSPYLGSRMNQGTLRNVERFGTLPKFTRCGDDAPRRAADGKIIAWVQGRAEFGPRALGNRSILADPRSPSIKETINAKVKFRAEFRTFAPSILHEHGNEYFEHYQESPYIKRTLKFRETAAGKVPSVVHEYGTGRLQTVKKHPDSPHYASKVASR